MLANFIKRDKLVLLLKTCIGASAVMLYEGIRVTNILSLAIFTGSYCLFFRRNSLETWRVKKISSLVAGIIWVLTYLHGTQVLNSYEISGLRKATAYIVMAVGLFLVIERIIEIIYSYSAILIIGERKERLDFKPWKIYVIILACWTPFFLWNFPGCVNSDSTTQVLQALGIYPYSNHHPVLQTWIIKGVFHVVSLYSDSYNLAIATFVIIQCLALAAIYTYVLQTIRNAGVSKAIFCIALAYYCIAPFNVMMSINMWKDTFFSGAMALMVTALWRIYCEDNLIDLFLLYLGGIIVCMYRNNGWYAFLVTLPFMIIFLWKKKKKACFILIMVFVTVITIRGWVFKIVDVAEPNIMESLAVPMQQISSVVANNGDIDEGSRELLMSVVELDKIESAYNPHEADWVKNIIVSEGNTGIITSKKNEFLRLWVKLGLKNPGLYLQAFVNQTEGFYTPDIQRWQYIEGVWDTDMPIYTTPLLPQPICKALKWYTGEWWYDIPILGLIKSIGFWVWILFIAFGLCLIKKEYKAASLFLPVLICWGTILLATPAYAEFRYAYSIFTTLPVLLVSSLYSRGNK